MDLALLKSELVNDPNDYGYSIYIAADVYASNMGALAFMLNQARPEITVRRNDVSSQEILQAIDIRDFKSNPSNAECAWFESATRQDSMRLLNPDGTDTQVAGNFRRLFANTNGTITRFSAICNRMGSRAEQLFGADTVVTWEQVKAALVL